MKLFINILFVFCGISFATAQIENTNKKVKFEAVKDNFKSPKGLELPARKTPSLTKQRDINPNSRYSDVGKESTEITMSKEDGLKDNKSNKAPKFFTKDKEAKEEFGRDQNLDSFTTGSGFLKILYRDHQSVDGDYVRIFVNGDVVQSRVYLDSSFKGITVRLDEGANVIEFQALNQGSSGPNTAELHVYDEDGEIISAKEWNLLTGFKAIVQVNKE